MTSCSQDNFQFKKIAEISSERMDISELHPLDIFKYLYSKNTDQQKMAQKLLRRFTITQNQYNDLLQEIIKKHSLPLGVYVAIKEISLTINPEYIKKISLFFFIKIQKIH